MNRRGFIRLLGGAVGGVLLEEAIPLGRVWSFPSEIKIIRGTVLNIRKPPLLTIDMITREALKILEQNLRFPDEFARAHARLRWHLLPGSDWGISKPVVPASADRD